MIAVDTNVVVRLLSRDDVEQHRRAYDLFKTNRVFIATTVVLECEWVLRYAYRLAPADIVTPMRRLFGLENVVLEDPDRIATALDWHDAGLDFADALHLAATHENGPFYTFDRKLIKGAGRLIRQPIREP
jgi:predicted nucleic-acid-binding protein